MLTQQNVTPEMCLSVTASVCMFSVTRPYLMSCWMCSSDSKGGSGTLHLWSPDSPYLYNLDVTLKVADNAKVNLLPALFSSNTHHG